MYKTNPHEKEKSKNIKVLMVTGVYYPEVNGAVLQCLQLIRNMAKSISFSVLTGTNNMSIHGVDYVEDILITRLFIPKRRLFESIVGMLRFVIHMICLSKKVDLIHIHGFSKRNSIAIAISRMLNKKVVLKMTSFGQDDPLSVRNRSFIIWQLFKCCHAYIGISPAFFKSYQEAGLPENRYNFIPNCVDLKIFSPLSLEEKIELKSEYGFSSTERIMLFVGHFSPEKRPMFAYKVWLLLHQVNPNVKLILIGKTKGFFEVDDCIVDAIKFDAANRGVLSSIYFVENTFNINEYMKIADVFLLPSTREGLPNVLLEAMACSLPCFVTNIPGVTDWLVDDEISGFLLKSDEPSKWAEKIMPYVIESRKSEVGSKARQFVENNFSFNLTSVAVNDLYNKII